MEDLKVSYDYSVRTANNSIVQFINGDDGMDATSVESQPLLLTKFGIDKISEMFQFSEDT